MVTLPNLSPIFQSTHSLSTEAKRSLKTDAALPGIKRGIAIGVACSVSIVLIAILAFCAIKRRNRILASEQQHNTPKALDVEAQPELQEKTQWTKAYPPSQPSPIPPPQPPVEVDAHMIYELDAGYTPELHGETRPQEIEGCDKKHTVPEEAEDMYSQKPKQWRGENIAANTNPKTPADAVTH